MKWKIPPEDKEGLFETKDNNKVLGVIDETSGMQRESA